MRHNHDDIYRTHRAALNTSARELLSWHGMTYLRQALLMAATAGLFAVIPSYFKPSYPIPEIFGTVAPGFEKVREVFRKNYEDNWDNPESGSAFSVYYKGEKVVDLWAGYADLEANRLWKEDTMTIIFSTSKGFAALCAAILVDRGYLDFKKTVAHYWPEFAQHGKENITVEQLLEHEAGLVGTDSPLSYSLLEDHNSLDKILAEAKPKWKPGERHGYHAITFGPYVDALIRRVDPKKRTIGQFFDQEVSKPFGIDAYIGAPLEESHRIGRSSNLKLTKRLSHIIYAIRNIGMFQRFLMGRLFGGGETEEVLNVMFQGCGDICEIPRLGDPDIRRIEFASGNGVATARAVAKSFGILANGGVHDNKTLLSKSIIDEYVHDKRGPTPDLVMFDHPIRWKYGMDVIPQGPNAGNLFGSPGIGGQVGYADPNNNIGYGFISRHMSPMGIQMLDPRFKNLQESVLNVIRQNKEKL